MSAVTSATPRTLLRRRVRTDAAGACARALREWSVCLESRYPLGERTRYSYAAFTPVATLTAYGRRATFRWTDGGVRSGDVLALLDEVIHDGARPAGGEDLPWIGGAAGYVGYDFGRVFERRADGARDALGVPDVALGVYDALVVTDHAAGRTEIVASGWPLAGAAARAEAERRLDRLEEILAVPAAAEQAHVALPAVPCTLARDVTYADYVARIAHVQRLIRAGDIYQANVAQRFSGAYTADPRETYARVRDGAPAPYSAAVLTPDAQVFSASPELFLERRGEHVVTRPIKGTRARGAHAAEDARLAAELLASEKDRAEHVMIVDVERNDLGRVAVAGGVSVDELAAIETFASVHHLTSTVSARLRSGVRTSDLLRATFPSGSISGAPKLRAMEIIDQVEPVRRSVYTGAIGWFGFGGDCQLSMGIRILLAARGRLHLWAGGGIVADSRVEEEYEETLVKGRALARAIGADLDATVEAAR